jgi:hypothetical protein
MKLASVFNFLLFQVNYGAHIRSRTGDLFITNEVLYRLSYASLTLYQLQAVKPARIVPTLISLKSSL